MIREIDKDVAIEQLLQKDGLKHSDDIITLLESTEVKIFMSDLDFGLVIFQKAGREEGSSSDAILIADNHEVITDLINAFEKNVNYYLLTYDKVLEEYLRAYFEIVEIESEIGGNLLLYTNEYLLEKKFPNNYEKVVVLEKKHKDIVSKSTSEKTRRYYGEFCLYMPSEYKAYGIILNGSLVSSCIVTVNTLNCGQLNIAEPIWVYTEDKYRCKGFGKAVLYRAVKDLIENEKLVTYHCAGKNESSYSIATSIGFRKKAIEYSYLAKLKN